MRRIFYSISILLLLTGPVFAQAGITPCASATISASSGSSTNVHLSTCGQTVILWNTTSQEAFYKLGTASNTAATTGDNSIPGGAFVVLNAGFGGSYLAAITAASSTTLRVTQGQTR